MGKDWPPKPGHGPLRLPSSPAAPGFFLVILLPSSLTQNPQTRSNFFLSCWPELIKSREAFKVMTLFTETCGMQRTFFFHFQNKQLKVRNSAPPKFRIAFPFLPLASHLQAPLLHKCTIICLYPQGAAI